MKTIEYYNENVAGAQAFPDHECESRARGFLLSDATHIGTTTELFITAVRVLIAEGVFPPEQVIFRFREEKMQVDHNGRLDHWPVGFGDTWDNFLIRLLK